MEKGISLGEKLVLLRKKKRVHQQDVGDFVGVTQKTISKWELDQSEPDLYYKEKLSEFYGEPIDYFYATIENKKEPVKSDKSEKSVTALLLERLHDEGVIGDLDNIDKDILDMIINAVKIDYQLLKSKAQ